MVVGGEGGGQRNEDGIFKKKMYLSKLIPEFFHGFVKIFVRITLSYTWICQNCYMDLIVFTWIVKVVLCISRPLSNKTKLKFYKDFNTC